MSGNDRHDTEETPVERLLREALDARAQQVTAQSLRPPAPPKTRIRRLRPVVTAAVPLFGLAAGVVGYVTLSGTPTAMHHEQPPAATLTAVPTPSPTDSPAATASAAASASPSREKRNGTAGSGLTISDGTQYVVMGGSLVDFGIAVRDLAWSPDGRKAAFVTDQGDLVVSKPDGSGRVVVAKNPGGQTWSHPTWQVADASAGMQLPARSNLILTVEQGGVTSLKVVASDATGATPMDLRLQSESGPSPQPNPTTGNLWPNAIGSHGTSVYANSSDGKVYLRDDYARQQGGPVVDGSEPALSPDEQQILFVRSNGTHDHLFVYDLNAHKAKDLTPDATTDYTEPVFSPDGRTIAVRTPDGVATLPADGSAAPVLISDYTGLPAYRHA